MNAAVMLLALFGFTLLRWQAAAIAVGVVGFPVLLADYLVAGGALRGRPRRLWIAAVVLGAMLGAGWAFGNGIRIARTHGIGLGAGIAGGPVAESLGVPLAAVLLMVMPAVVVRMTDRSPQDRLLGLIVGVLGATTFGVTATLVRLAPQLATGLVASRRPMEGLLVEAGIRGIVIPLTSAAIGGIAGVALWNARRRWTVVAALAAVTVIGAFAGGSLVDSADLAPANQLLLHLLVTVVALAALWWCIRAGDISLPRVPGRLPRIPVVAGLAAAVAAATGLSLLMTPPVPVYACPPDCGLPPTGRPVQNNPLFTAPEFSVSYPGDESGYSVTADASGVVATFEHGDGGVLRLFGEPARGRTAAQIVNNVVHTERRTATKVYELPSAMVGYQPGYGEVDDDYPISATGAYLHLRLVTLAAVKDDYALIATASGPFHQYGPQFGPGPPSAVNLGVGLDMDTYVNSFRWRGDPDR